MKPRVIDLGYRPRDRFVAFHKRRQRWACLIAHRRAGKSVACVMDLVDDALRCNLTSGRFAYLAPTYTQAKDVAWSYLKRFTAPLPGVVQRESDLTVFLPNGARVRLYGADNYDRLRGGYQDGIVLDEYQDMDPRAWPEVLRPALADRNGWAVFCGTPKGRNHLYDVHANAEANSDWFSLVLKASETGILDNSELADMRRTLTADQYDQELECSFEAAIRGAIFRAELASAREDGRICGVPYDPSVPVWTAWDLGIGDATAIWCAQIVGREVHMIDYYEASGESLDHYCAWLDRKPYRYAGDLLPHDARARELGTGKSREEMLRANGRKVRIVPQLSVEDGINAARLLFPRAWFDAERCRVGIESLQLYRREFNERMGEFRATPVHDRHSHSADSFRMLAVGLRETTSPPKPKPAPQLARASSTSWMGA